MNETRAYLESDIWHARQKDIILPNRTNITLENWDGPNMGGDYLALLLASGVFTIILILVETACLVWVAEKISRRCKRHKVTIRKPRVDLESPAPEHSVENLNSARNLNQTDRLKEGDVDVKKEADRVAHDDFDGLIRVQNLRKEYSLGI